MATTKNLNYRKLNDELTGILERLQTGELDIDEAMVQYERGMEIVKLLQNYLKTAENKVTIIKQQF